MGDDKLFNLPGRVPVVFLVRLVQPYVTVACAVLAGGKAHVFHRGGAGAERGVEFEEG